MWTDWACAEKLPHWETGKLRSSGEGTHQRGESTKGPSKSQGNGPQIARVHVKPDTPMCWLYLGNKKTYSLVDSGADISLISRETFDKIAAKNVSEFSTKNCTPLQSVSGHKLKSFGTAVLQVKISKFSQPYRFQIVDGLKKSVHSRKRFLVRLRCST